MSASRFLSGVCLAMMVLSTSSQGGPVSTDPVLRDDLIKVSRHRVLFGHQSVGANILDGVRELASASGVPLQVVDVKAAVEIGPGTLGHTFVAENGNPLKKLASFEQAIGGNAVDLDMALIKFCYVDIASDTDVKALFKQYQATLGRLRASHPRTVFVHVTAPLTDIQQGPKALMKKWIGRAPYGIAENIRRDEYNELLRQAYAGREPLFDLARVESTGRDGRQVKVEWRGQTLPALAGEFTDDGGHLNAEGRLKAARELISVLAAAGAVAPSVGTVEP